MLPKNIRPRPRVGERRTERVDWFTLWWWDGDPTPPNPVPTCAKDGKIDLNLEKYTKPFETNNKRLRHHQQIRRRPFTHHHIICPKFSAATWSSLALFWGPPFRVELFGLFPLFQTCLWASKLDPKRCIYEVGRFVGLDLGQKGSNPCFQSKKVRGAYAAWSVWQTLGKTDPVSVFFWDVILKPHR